MIILKITMFSDVEKKAVEQSICDIMNAPKTHRRAADAYWSKGNSITQKGNKDELRLF